VHSNVLSYINQIRLLTKNHHELQGAMFAIELVAQKGWLHLWLETYSILVNLAFTSHKIVPWHLKNI